MALRTNGVVHSLFSGKTESGVTLGTGTVNVLLIGEALFQNAVLVLDLIL